MRAMNVRQDLEVRNMKTKEFREKIAESFVKSLSENPKEWKQEWSAPGSNPRNAVSGKNYKGINFIWLSYIARIKGYKDPRWATFKQAQSKEWKVKKGEKGSYIEYWMPYDKSEKKILTWDEYNELASKKSEKLDDIRLLSKYFTVFNVEQMENVPELCGQIGNEINPAELIDKISSGMGVEIINDGGNEAFYRIKEDKIHLPLAKYFDDDYAYNATALHELSHATGHPSRLNRIKDGGLNREYYAYEELVAEISSCFTAGNLPLAMSDEHFENHKAYIASWIEGIKNKPEILARAIGDAQRAADYIELKAGILSENEYKIKAEETIETDKDRTKGYSDEDDKIAVDMEVYQERMDRQKAYVREYLEEYFANYDFDSPRKVLAEQVPSMILEDKFALGGMYETEEECRAFIELDSSAKEHTMYDIEYSYPELSDITPESNPKMFSLMLMEREIEKMMQDSKTLEENKGHEIYFDKKIVNEICRANNIKMPKDVKMYRMKVPGMELDL